MPSRPLPAPRRGRQYGGRYDGQRFLIAGGRVPWPSHATPAPAPAGRRKDRRSQQAGGGVGHPLQVAEGLPGFPGNPRHGAEVDITLRVPIISPSSGVIPIEVSTLHCAPRRSRRHCPWAITRPLSCSATRAAPGRAGTHIAVRGAVETVAACPGFWCNTPTADHREKLPGPGLVKADIKTATCITSGNSRCAEAMPLNWRSYAAGPGTIPANVIDNLANNDRLGEQVAAVGDAVANQATLSMRSRWANARQSPAGRLRSRAAPAPPARRR